MTTETTAGDQWLCAQCGVWSDRPGILCRECKAGNRKLLAQAYGPQFGDELSKLAQEVAAQPPVRPLGCDPGGRPPSRPSRPQMAVAARLMAKHAAEVAVHADWQHTLLERLEGLVLDGVPGRGGCRCLACTVWQALT